MTNNPYPQLVPQIFFYTVAILPTNVSKIEHGYFTDGQLNKAQAILLTVITVLIIGMMFIHTGAFILLQGTNVLSEQLVELIFLIIPIQKF